MEDYNTKHKEKMEVLSNTCQCYTIAVDEAENDNEKVIAMVVRFNDNLTFYQTLLIVKLFSISPTGENITNWILQTLKDYKMDTKKLVGLTTDGANVMKGHWNGVNGLLQQKYNYNLIYNHCYCHRLNLVLTKTEQVPTMQTFFKIIR